MNPKAAQLIQEILWTKSGLENSYSFYLVFRSDRSGNRFTGKPVSQTTGLYYYYHRWYDPSIGRFISQDPKPCPLSECQKLNRYVYVTNRPTTLTDPDGEGTIMCQTPDGMISSCGILRDSLGNLPPGTRILGSGAQPTMSSAGPGTTTMPDPSSEITAPTGLLRDNFGNLPPGTRISVVRTPTGSIVMGTTTVGNINQQIAEDRAKLGSPDTSGGTTSSGGLISDLTRAINQIPPCWQVTLGVLVLVGIYGSLLTISIPTGGLAGVAVVLALSDEITFRTLAGAGLIALGLSRMTDSSHSVPCWTN